MFILNISLISISYLPGFEYKAVIVNKTMDCLNGDDNRIINDSVSSKEECEIKCSADEDCLFFSTNEKENRCRGYKNCDTRRNTTDKAKWIYQKVEIGK